MLYLRYSYRFDAGNFMITPKQKTLMRAELTLAHHDYEKGLNARAYFKVGNHATGEDLVQDTFIKTWSYLVKGGKIETMKGFLYHILNNLIIDQYRKHKATSLEILLEKGFEPSVDPSSKLFDTLDAKALLLLIKQLPKKYQKIMRMRHEDDSSLEEISIEMKQTKNTIAVQLHRGLEKLKVLYHPL
jgi:RNA polymerase sigma-70 factor (ECF subfamily)